MVDGNDCSGCSAPTRTPVRRSSSGVEHVEPARTGEVHDERAGLDRRARPPAAPARSRGRVSRRSPAPRRAPTSDTSAVRVARHAAADVGRRRVGRPARDRRRRSSPARPGRARSSFPARPGPIRATVRCSFRHGGRNVTAASRHAFPRRRRRRPARARRRAAAPARSPRSHIRGCGIVSSGSSSATSSYSRTSTSSVRGPHRSPRTRCASRSMLLREREQRVRIERRCRSRRPRSGTRPAAGHRRARSRTRARPRRRRRRRPPRARRPRAADARAGRRGSNRARGTRGVTARRARRRSRACARTGGCSLRTSTTTPTHARIGAAHLGDPRREPFEQLVAAPTTTTRLTASQTAP